MDVDSIYILVIWFFFTYLTENIDFSVDGKSPARVLVAGSGPSSVAADGPDSNVVGDTSAPLNFLNPVW